MNVGIGVDEYARGGDLLNSRFGYVAVSRASHEATIFTNDITRLGQQLGSEVSKTSALGLNQNVSPARGQGIGLSL
jgi:hypothetical protein